MRVPALNAKLSLVHLIRLGRNSRHQFAVKAFQEELTSTSTVGARSSDEFKIHSILLIEKKNDIWILSSWASRDNSLVIGPNDNGIKFYFGSDKLIEIG
jgi:hypothetical protein